MIGNKYKNKLNFGMRVSYWGKNIMSSNVIGWSVPT